MDEPRVPHSLQNLLSLENQSTTPFNHQNQPVGPPVDQLLLQLQMNHILQAHQQQQMHQQQLHQQQQQQHLQHLHQHNSQQQQHHLQHNHHHRNQRNNNSITTNGRPSKVALIDLVTCKLCKGYLIDAATIDLCMHSFCRPCAVKYIREKPRCPECNIEIKDKRYLNRLKTDHTIQTLVYKLVPGLYEKEMARRRKFYATRPSTTPRYPSEMFGDIPPSKTIKSDDMLNVSITWNKDCPNDTIKTYLHLRADSSMEVLKKLIIGKFGLDGPIKIYYGNAEIFFNLTTLLEVASTYNWAPENKVLDLNFKEEEDRISISSSPQQNSAPDL